MRLPWQRRRTERRSYTDTITSAFQAAAEGGTSTAPLATAAVETATGLHARCLAAATVRGAPDDIQAALTPLVLAQIGRELVRRGESL